MYHASAAEFIKKKKKNTYTKKCTQEHTNGEYVISENPTGDRKRKKRISKSEKDPS